MVSTEERRKIGKRNRAKGQRFENLVRKDLEKKGFICDKWTNNVKTKENKIPIPKELWKLEPAKRKYNLFKKTYVIGTGFPDFICLKHHIIFGDNTYEVIGVEVKFNGRLSPCEKEKCMWYLEKNIFSKILIASHPKRGVIKYKEFEK